MVGIDYSYFDLSKLGLSLFTPEEKKMSEEDLEYALKEIKEGKVSFYDQIVNNVDTFKSKHPKFWKNAKIFGIPFGLFCGSVAVLSALNNYATDSLLERDNTYTVSSFRSMPYITLGNGTGALGLTVDGMDRYNLTVHDIGIGGYYMNLDLTNNTIVNESCEGKEEIDVYLNFCDSEFTPAVIDKIIDKIGASGCLYRISSVNCDYGLNLYLRGF